MAILFTIACRYNGEFGGDDAEQLEVLQKLVQRSASELHTGAELLSKKYKPEIVINRMDTLSGDTTDVPYLDEDEDGDPVPEELSDDDL